ncbi:HNH endonuclease signature motif containing protein [Paracoccus sp. J55]|uniref:HNH endonuclease signature motif containing protein n=1 Tax=Paracoccus sp. J55 TaxID=935849 RepID=UPI001E4782DB|nr:HNH endonuclease signature motif containing protein [Paracoccus sp. J55]
MCGADATVVDHIKPHRGDQALFWNWNNWQALCTGCHSSVKQRQEVDFLRNRRLGIVKITQP